MTETVNIERLLTIKDLKEFIPLSQAGLYKLTNSEGFPKPVKLGTRRKAWTAASITQWMRDAAA